MEILAQKISKVRLTHKESVVAEYILSNANKVCFMSAKDLAKTFGTSDTTVNRMAKAVGYGSFNELQRELRDGVTRDVEHAQSILVSPLERLVRKEENCERGSLDIRFSELMVENLESVFLKNPEEKLNRVVELMDTSARKFIVGQRPTADLANKFAFLLRMVTAGVEVASDSTAFERVLDISERDCVFAIDFNQYSKNAYQILTHARARGANIILMTDRTTAPFAYLADELLVVDVYSLSFFNSNVAPLFLLELLCTKIAFRDAERTKHRLNLLNPYFDSHKWNVGQ